MIVAVGLVRSRVKLTALPVSVLPALSVAFACTVYVPAVCDDHVGRVTLSVHVAEVLPVVALCVVARLETPACQAEPVQYWPSGRWRVKVVLLAFKPTPLALSAALPLKGAGTLLAA